MYHFMKNKEESPSHANKMLADNVRPLIFWGEKVKQKVYDFYF